jgi:cytochrome c553
MRLMSRLFAVAVAVALAAASIADAQSGSVSGPSWAYGLPPTSAPAPAPAPGGQGGGAARTPDTSLKHIPDSTQAFSLPQLRDFFNVADWFPSDHPAMPDVFVHGRAPDVLGCGMCHMPNGKGRPENAPIAGLPYEYVVQQLLDFKNDLRTSADPRKSNTGLMIKAAKAMTEEEIKAAASYLASMSWTPWIRVVETETVPSMRLAGNVFLPLAEGGTEPLGERIVETPEDAARFELRDPHSGFIAYVPRGSVAKGAAMAASGGNKTLPCTICHGPTLNGLGPVPGIAGRSPSYIVRQLWDIQQGTRKGAWSPLMKQVVAKLTQEDMLNLAAYAATLGR